MYGNPRQVGQSHKLRETWTAEDYATQSQQYAKVSQQYHQLISERSLIVDSEIARLNQSLNYALKEIKRLESNQWDCNRTSLLWGASGAIVAALVVNLLVAAMPQPTPQPYYPSNAWERSQ